ncbi:GNAT family N-acetyltransferase [Burkholderia gladioli]|uniref:GNAT family N-acetyltransferase n=1 Tax=Burkholderia gladioli TaxID=28095 RepID=UPI00163EA387|nr:GNAT family N-acetyltransferase [Burkholderia gladioli]
MTYTYTLTDVADDTVRKQIAAPLVAYNDRNGGPSGNRPLVVALRDAAGEVTGGLWASTAYGWLAIQLLVVPESARGCHAAWLDTFEFQARPFYERLGYQCFAELPDYPPGFSRMFMKKTLRPL